MPSFIVDQRYTREDVLRSLGFPGLPKGGSWNTGYHQFGGEVFIFCNVGVAGRTGHNYSNQFVADRLWWEGKTGSHAQQPLIAYMCQAATRVHLFWREQARAAFRYAGLARAEQVESTVPVRILWSFRSEAGTVAHALAEEIAAVDLSQAWIEGAVREIKVNAYERNPQARARCIEIHGENCKACGFNFSAMYGPLGQHFIHVHHLIPISQLGGSYTIDPEHDLVPLCANCHAMVHRQQPPLSIAALRHLIAAQAGSL